MSNYSQQYLNYYDKLINQKEHRKNFYGKSSNNNKFSNIIIRHIIGSLILFSFVIFCTTFQGPKVDKVYGYFRKVITKEYKKDEIFSEIREFSIEENFNNMKENIENSNLDNPLKKFFHPNLQKSLESNQYRGDSK